MWHFNCVFTIFIVPYSVDFNTSYMILKVIMLYLHWFLDFCLFSFTYYLHEDNFLLGTVYFPAWVHFTMLLSSHRAHSTMFLLPPWNDFDQINHSFSHVPLYSQDQKFKQENYVLFISAHPTLMRIIVFSYESIDM